MWMYGLGITISFRERLITPLKRPSCGRTHPISQNTNVSKQNHTNESITKRTPTRKRVEITKPSWNKPTHNPRSTCQLAEAQAFSRVAVSGNSPFQQETCYMRTGLRSSTPFWGDALWCMLCWSGHSVLHLEKQLSGITADSVCGSLP